MAVEGDEGSDIFWPGYVDAVTNLVLNLLFILTIMIVAVFMFALELSRHKDDVAPPTTATPMTEQVASDLSTPNEAPEIVGLTKLDEVVKAKDVEVSELEKRIEDLQQQVNAARQRQEEPKVVIAKSPLKQPEKSLEDTVRNGGIVVLFKLDSVTLSDEEADKLRQELSSFVEAGGARIEVFAPKGFSEAKRIAFYRAIAVRNQFIEMNIPSENLTVLVHDGPASSDNSKVLISKP